MFDRVVDRAGRPGGDEFGEIDRPVDAGARRDDRAILAHGGADGRQDMGVVLDYAHAKGWRSTEAPSGNGSLKAGRGLPRQVKSRSEEHTSELQSLMRISYAVFC